MIKDIRALVASQYSDIGICRRTSRSSFFKMASCDYFPIFLCFFLRLVHTQIHTYADTQIRFVLSRLSVK